MSTVGIAKKKPVVQSNSFLETVYHKLQHKWHCLAVYCIFQAMRTTVEQNLKLLFVSYTINLNSDAFRPLCWVLVVRRRWGSLIRRVEVSFKSGMPYSTFLLPEHRTLVWMLVSYGQSQTSVGLSDVYYFRVCAKWHFHGIKLMEWVNHLGLPLIPIRQSSQVKKVTQLVS